MNKILNQFQEIHRILRKAKKKKKKNFKFYYSKQQKRVSIKFLNIMSSKNVKNIFWRCTHVETELFAEILSDPDLQKA